MADFKIGDWVKICTLEHEEFMGMVGFIRDIGTPDLNWHGIYEVQMGDSENTKLYCKGTELVLAQIADTKIARKMYPKAEKRGDYLILKGDV